MGRNQFTQDKTIQAVSQGQILPGSAFGDLLTKYAREARTVVELGTWTGQGSTKCLAEGLSWSAEGYALVSVEIDPGMHAEACEYWKESEGVQILLGRVGQSFDEFDHPEGLSAREALGYEFCRQQFLAAPDVLHLLPPEISLLLIDAGEFSASGELDALIGRTEIVALDDTSPLKAHKNVANRQRLLNLGWTVLADDQDSRNGYAIFKRPQLPR